jgi:hypothetical protein
MNKFYEIIKVAEKGNYEPLKHKSQMKDITHGDIRAFVCDSNFWFALGRASGWTDRQALMIGTRFHTRNLQQGWDAAIWYLNEQIH